MGKCHMQQMEGDSCCYRPPKKKCKTQSGRREWKVSHATKQGRLTLLPPPPIKEKRKKHGRITLLEWRMPPPKEMRLHHATPKPAKTKTGAECTLLHGTRSSVDDGPPPKRCACTGLNSRYDAIFELRKASTISPEASNSCGVKSILKRFDWARSASHEPRK